MRKVGKIDSRKMQGQSAFRLQLSENVSNKKLAPKLAFLNGKKEEIIRWFFDIWNWLWSSEFSYLWPSILKQSKCQDFLLMPFSYIFGLAY